MKYQNKSDLLAYFQHQIEKEVSEELQSLHKEIEKLKYDAKIAIEKELKEEQEKTVALTKAEWTRNYQLKLAEYQRKLDLTVINKRTQLINELFDALEKKLKQFTKKDQYNTWIETRLNQWKDLNIKMVQVDPTDTHIGQSLGDISVEHKPGLIGGFVIYTHDSNKIIDESFKQRIAEAKEWFYQNVKWLVEEEHSA